MGYKYTGQDLVQAATDFRQAGQALNAAVAAPPGGVNAGASSGIVENAIADLFHAVTIAAQAADGIANNIHATNGSYDEIENTNAGDIRRSGNAINDYTQSNQFSGS